jgi:uncharacterized membrane protein SirB2
MKIFLFIISVLLILMGGVWFLQGMNVLLGSPMSGQMTWVINGAIAVIIGIVLFVWNYRRKSSPPRK